MINEADTIWLRFQCDSQPKAHLLQEFGINAVDAVAAEKRIAMREKGRTFSSGAITFFAKKLAEAIKNTEGNTGVPSKIEMTEEISKSAIELVVLLYTHALEFSDLRKEILRNATLDCVYEDQHETTAIHVSIPGNPFDKKILSHSVHLDMFLENQR